jgi:hypothetical protein
MALPGEHGCVPTVNDVRVSDHGQLCNVWAPADVYCVVYV